MTTKTKSSSQVPSIYPIYLTENAAIELVEKFASNDMQEATRFRSQYSKYEYYASIRESGEVEISVSYNSDDGFCMQSGRCLNKIIRPYSDEQLVRFKQRQMFAIAEAEYFKRKREREIIDILKVQNEIFGE